MTESKGNIWDFHAQGYVIVIPTNNTVNAKGECVMGRGVALQARRKFPKLAVELGTLVKQTKGSEVHWFPEYRLFAFPVKHHWGEEADIELIADSAQKLTKLISALRYPIYLPRVGCGNGKLRWKTVEPVLNKYLEDRFFRVVKLEIK